MTGEGRLRRLEEKYGGFKVYDNQGSSIGKVDDLFAGEDDREEYIGVKMGLFGMSGTALIPIDIVRINERDRTLEVAEPGGRIRAAPKYEDGAAITPEYENEVRRHFDLGDLEPSATPLDRQTGEGVASEEHGQRTTRVRRRIRREEIEDIEEDSTGR